jgi:hypothetical protein
MALSGNVSRINYGSCIPQDTWFAATNQVFCQGSIILVKADGYAYVGAAYATASAGFVLGVAAYELDTTGIASGVSSVVVDPGTWGDFSNSAAADAIAEDDRGKLCYLVDDDTVALTDDTGARTAAGRIHSLADDGASVVIQFEVLR